MVKNEMAASRDERKPWYTTGLLCIAVTAVSSAGAVTKLMEHSGPVSRAAWRLQMTAILLLPGFLWDWWWLPPAQRRNVLRVNTIAVLAAAAVALAFHFALWIWSLDTTSLPHSLLLVSTPPVILVVFSWLRCMPLSIGETIGTALATFGVVVIASFARVEKDNEATFFGDLAAFFAAIAFVVYVLAGKRLRGWMPLYLYSFPIMGGAAIVLSLTCSYLDGRSDYVRGPFGWLRRELFFLNIYLALVPGVAGHTGFIFLLKYIDPLVISMGISLEPVIGSLIGWLLNVSSAPGLATCAGGLILIAGSLIVIFFAGSASRTASEGESYNELGEATTVQGKDLSPIIEDIVCYIDEAT